MGQVGTFACAVILFVLAGMAVLAWTDPDRKRRRSGVTLDTEYNIQPVPQPPQRPVTPRHGTRVIHSRGMPEGYDPPTELLHPRGQADPRHPYVPPVPSRASRVHDRFHCPGCQCR